MHRDKCGAASVCGFFRIIAFLKPPGLRVYGSMACVRNSVGEDCYVSDEIVTSRAGVRVRVGNTDAEGRMVMADLLCEMKELALKPEIGGKDPLLFTIATLTGHVVRCYGTAYSGIMDNGYARKLNIARSIQDSGDIMSDPFEVSVVRREDWEFHGSHIDEYADTRNSSNIGSTNRSRGHMTPPAFMQIAAGLDKHGLDSDHPLAYTHIDIAGSSGHYPGIPTGTPLLALSHRFLLPCSK